ncbi:peptidase S10 [soil metagenome]
MSTRLLSLWLGCFLLGPAPIVQALDDEPDRKDSKADSHEKDKDSKSRSKEKDDDEEVEPTVTHHELEVGDESIKYTATAGMLPLKDEEGEIEARIFYIAYTLDEVQDRSERPLMFSFNGGPGSSSVWLHLGALGPKRVPMPEDASIPAPPYRLLPNEFTWLTETDLVFIDPVGTGYSRAAKPEDNRKYYGLSPDIEAISEFIRLYLTRERRWTSPLYLVGESYGTTRAAGLSEHLVDRGIALNGIALVSSVLNFQTIRFGTGNDLPYILFLPTYAATAHYHDKLDNGFQEMEIRDFLDVVEEWATGDYARALQRGDRLSVEERAEIVEQLSAYTGLDPTFLENANLRIEIQRFCKELLRDRARTVGRLDSRFRGIDALNAGETPDFDPSMAAIRPPYTSTLNQYLRDELEYESDVPYFILGEGVQGWDFGISSSGGYADTGNALRNAMAKNPHMKVFIASGYYDLATPYAATEYTLSHLGLDPELRENFQVEEYEAGHMMYIREHDLEALKEHVAEFIKSSKGS